LLFLCFGAWLFFGHGFVLSDVERILLRTYYSKRFATGATSVSGLLSLRSSQGRTHRPFNIGHNGETFRQIRIV
jgi:hypothetical protein